MNGAPTVAARPKQNLPARWRPIQSIQPSAGLGRFRRVGEALDQRSQLADAVFALLQLNQRLSLVQVGRGNLRVVRVVLQEMVVVSDCGTGLVALKRNLSEIVV